MVENIAWLGHDSFRIVDALAVALVVGAMTALLVHLRRERASQG